MAIKTIHISQNAGFQFAMIENTEKQQIFQFKKLQPGCWAFFSANDFGWMELDGLYKPNGGKKKFQN